MRFERIGGQAVRSDDGYVVRSTGRETYEYAEAERVATIAVDRGASLGIYPRTIRWTTPVEHEPTDEERAMILGRVSAGLRALGIWFEVVEQPA